MSLTRVDICNQALYRIGANNPITSLEEGSAESEVLAAQYDVALYSLLTAFPWPWARRITALQEVAGEVHPVWSKIYKYPVNCVRILDLFNSYAPDQSDGLRYCDQIEPSGLPVEYELSSGRDGRYILTDLVGAYAQYIYAVDDPMLWDPAFRQALIARLAADCCLALSAQDGRHRELQEIAQRAYYAATATGAAESRESRRRRGRYVKARR
nr:hypothetical protein [uncultured Dethiosulfovibrio sp.]